MSDDIYVRVTDSIVIQKIQDVAEKRNMSVDSVVERILVQCNDLDLIEKAMGPLPLDEDEMSRR